MKKFKVDARALALFIDTHVKSTCEMRCSSSGNDLLIYGTICDDDCNAMSVVQALAQIDSADPVRVRINSPGGDVFEGLAIYQALQRHQGKVQVCVDGVAASAAALIAMAGTDSLIANTGVLMLHNAWTICVGNRQDMQDSIDKLAIVDAAQNEIFSKKSGKTCAEITDILDTETWYSAQEAIDNGFISAMVDNKKKMMSPDEMMMQVNAEAEAVAKELEDWRETALRQIELAELT